MADRAPSLRILAYGDAVAQGVAVGKAPAAMGRTVAGLVERAVREGRDWPEFEMALRRRGLIQDPPPAARRVG